MKCLNCNEHVSHFWNFMKISWFSGRSFFCKNCGEELLPGPFGKTGNYLIAFLAPIIGIVFSNTVEFHLFDRELFNAFVLEFPLLIAIAFFLLYLLWLFGKYKRVTDKGSMKH